MNINDMSEEEQIRKVVKNQYIFRYIENPSEAVQLSAVKKNVVAIEYINNPSKDVLITALLIILKDGGPDYVERLMKKFSNRNYPEFGIIRRSIEADK